MKVMSQLVGRTSGGFPWATSGECPTSCLETKQRIYIRRKAPKGEVSARAEP